MLDIGQQAVLGYSKLQSVEIQCVKINILKKHSFGQPDTQKVKKVAFL